MLEADQIDALTNPVIDLYEEYQLSVIRDIARRLSNMSFDSAAWQVQRLHESGMVYSDALKELAKLTGKSERELAEIFKRAGVRTLRYDDAVYKAAGLDVPPLKLSPAMARLLEIGLQKTNGVMNNLTLTTALTAQQTFIHAADLAYMQITSGAMSYQQAIRAAVKSVGASGLEVMYPGGRSDKLDVAMFRTVRTGVGQTAHKLQDQRADDLDSDLVQVSAHIGARNKGVGPANHESWQGKVYSRSGTSRKYPDFVKTTGYGTGEGLGGWNCRHTFYPFFEGLSKQAYTSNERRNIANEKVKFLGHELDAYEATQTQREIERKIRFWKRQEAAVTAAKLDAMKEAEKVRQYQELMRRFIRETELQRQRFREQV